MRTVLVQLGLFFGLAGSPAYGFTAGEPMPTASDRYRAVAESLYYEGNYEKALEYYQKAYHLVEHSDVVRAANLCVDIGTIYYVYGHYLKAKDVCHLALSTLGSTQAPADSVRFKLYSSLGEMYHKLGNRDSCAWFFDQGNQLFDRLPSLQSQIPAYVLYHYNNQGLMCVRMGNYSQGVVFLNKALSIAQEMGDQREASIVRNNLALLHEQRGNFEEGLQLRLKAAAQYTAEDIDKCLIYSGIGWNLLRTAHYPEALQYLNRSYRLYEKQVKARRLPANPAFEAMLLNNFGQCYSNLPEVGHAARAYEKAIGIWRRHYGPDGRTLARSYVGLASLQVAGKNLTRAKDFINQAIVACDDGDTTRNQNRPRVVYEQTLFEVLSFKGEVAYQQYQLNPARQLLVESLSAYQQAFAVADGLRRSYNAPESSLYFQATIYPAYEKALVTAYQLYADTKETIYQEAALEILEKSRFAVLADGVRELQLRPEYIPPALLEREHELQQEITRLKYRHLGPKDALADREQLIGKEIELARLLGEFERKYPAYYRAKYSKEAFSVRLLQEKLDEQTAYVSYQWVAPFLYIAVVTRQDHQIHRVSVDAQAWEQHTQGVRRALYQNPGLSTYKGTLPAIQLYQWLIEPVAAHLATKERLVVSRDASLNWLPLEVLETGKSAGDYLGKRFAIAYTYSAAAYLTELPNKAHAYPSATLSFAPYAASNTAHREVSRSGMGYLPASAEEVSSIGGKVFIGKTATKAQFLQTFAAAPVIHLATHAQTNDQEPAASFIAFYPENEYHKLFSEEIHLLDCRRTKLVILSACETGHGKLHWGEGLMSLARAFSLAGCPSVLTTIWKSHDQSTAYLAARFHHHARQGLPLDEALHKARLDFFDSALGRQFNHPYYWANFILLGDTTPVYEPVMSRTARWTLAGVPLLLGALGMVLYGRRSRRSGRQLPTR